MMVCWETLQILAASPVVNTVFMRSCTPDRPEARRTSSPVTRPGWAKLPDGKSSLIGLSSPFRLALPGRAGGRTREPWGARRGRHWRFQVYVEGEGEQSQTGVANLTTALDCNQAVRCVNTNRGLLPGASCYPDPLFSASPDCASHLDPVTRPSPFHQKLPAFATA